MLPWSHEDQVISVSFLSALTMDISFLLCVKKVKYFNNYVTYKYVSYIIKKGFLSGVGALKSMQKW